METVQDVLSKRARRLKQSHTDYLNNPYYPKNVHAVRVNSRKLRSLLSFLKPTIEEKKYDKLNEALKGLGQAYGPLREMDVLIDLCNQVAVKSPDLSDSYQQMFRYLHKERNAEMERTLVEADNNFKTIETVEADLNGLIFNTNADWNDFITERLEKKNKALKAAYRKVDRNEYEAIHDIRKEAKKLRYSARYLGKLASLKHKGIRKEARRIQEEFGKITDHHVNEQMLLDYADKVDDKNLKETFRKMSETQKGLDESSN
ncbi:CHAD domain-containing protein [Salinicoccus hispanicus]|uniref:CHAD domain-containing protein n=1 Tax=Salinicoccus hispanicus TaxID=157225 RepID=A0A6N8U1X1_9STAP|nr:CHAD domain-containing protein [Salinicoccus hispanicus]MXQ52064.1 CHAD domain-containing protein [Salinicoccus hispanicus]